MKNDGLLGRNFLKGMAGDAMNAVLCGAGHNLSGVGATIAGGYLRKILTRVRFGLYRWLLRHVWFTYWLSLEPLRGLQAA